MSGTDESVYEPGSAARMAELDGIYRRTMRQVHWQTAGLVAIGLAFPPAVGMVAWLVLR